MSCDKVALKLGNSGNRSGCSSAPSSWAWRRCMSGLTAGCLPAATARWGAKPHPERADHWLYATAELEGTRPLNRRVVVGHQRSGRRSTRLGESVSALLEVLEIREKPVSVEAFRTYSEVRLMKADLDLMVALDDPSWRAGSQHVHV